MSLVSGWNGTFYIPSAWPLSFFYFRAMRSKRPCLGLSARRRLREAQPRIHNHRSQLYKSTTTIERKRLCRFLKIIDSGRSNPQSSTINGISIWIVKMGTSSAPFSASSSRC